MPKTRPELDHAIDALAAWVPQMLAQTQESDQMEAFAARADLIYEAAGLEDRQHVWSRMQKILADHCLIPADEGPCA